MPYSARAVVQTLPTATVIPRVPVKFWRDIGILTRGGRWRIAAVDRGTAARPMRRWWQTIAVCAAAAPQVAVVSSLIRILGPLCSSALAE